MNMQPALRHTTGAKQITPQTIASQMLHEANGDMNAATTKMLNYIQAMPRLVDEVLAIGVRKLLNESASSDRSVKTREYTQASAATSPFLKAPHRMSSAVHDAQRRARKMGATATSALLSIPWVINGVSKPLREFIGSEVVGHGETMLSQGNTTVRNARFLIAVGTMAGAQKVGDAVDSVTVERLHAEAQG